MKNIAFYQDNKRKISYWAGLSSDHTVYLILFFERICRIYGFFCLWMLWFSLLYPIIFLVKKQRIYPQSKRKERVF